MKTLKDVKVGETATVARLHGEGPVKRRIMDMGITKGVEIYVRKVAPLGDPMELTVRNYELSVRKADAEGAAKFGMAAPMGARMMSGQTKWHEQLERELAAFVGKPDAFLLNYGYQGMVSIIDCLLTRRDVVVYDSEAHACIIDGLRLHTGKRFVYPHNDMAACRKQLERATKLAEENGGGVLVITEGVFGMKGDLGKLDEIVAMKKEFNFRLLVDDAHGFGTMGEGGRGTASHFGVIDGVDVLFNTFAKSMAGIGAFVASEKYIVDFLRYNMRSQTYAKSLPMPMVIGALKYDGSGHCIRQ